MTSGAAVQYWMAGMIPQEVHVGGMESSATPRQRRLTSWRKLHTAAEEEDYFVEETGAEDDDTVEDDEPDHEPCEEVPASCDSVSTVFPTVDRNIFLLQPRLSYLVT